MTPQDSNLPLCICGKTDCDIPYGYCHCRCGKLAKISYQDSTRFGHKRNQPRLYLLGHWNSVPPPLVDAAPFRLHGVYCRLIPLSRGMWTIVSAVDYEPLMRNRWTARWCSKGQRFYAVRHGTKASGKRPMVYMAREILGQEIPTGKIGDHYDGENTLDNSRPNLRPATRDQNQQNSRVPRNNTSGYKGVSFHKAAGKWIAQISFQGKKVYLGLFDTKEEAYVAYCAAAISLFGEFARLK